MNRKIFLAIGAAAFIVAALGVFLSLPKADADQAMRLPADPTPLVIVTAEGERSFTIEIADDERERSAGLMFRESMDDDHGMLFVFQQTRPVAFWMRNTPMPLDLVFVGEDGKVVDVLPGQPFSEAMISPGAQAPVRYVLELKRGMAGKAGIAAGSALRHPVIAQTAGAG